MFKAELSKISGVVVMKEKLALKLRLIPTYISWLPVHEATRDNTDVSAGESSFVMAYCVSSMFINLCDVISE